MKTLENTVKTFEKTLSEALGVNVEMKKNDGSFGVSYYLYLNLNDKFVEPLKIRLSDHSVSSNSRVLNEIHVSHDFELMNQDVLYIERLFYPERFKELKTITGSREIEWPESNINNFAGAYEVAEKRITKKGSVMLTLKIPMYKKTFNKI